MEPPRKSGIQCHKCRKDLQVLDQFVTDAHRGCDQSLVCESIQDKSLIFLVEDGCPDWIRSKVEEEGWTKGKLHCFGCSAKVGSFDFVSGRKCYCGQRVLPPVRLIRSQVDRATNLVLIPQ